MKKLPAAHDGGAVVAGTGNGRTLMIEWSDTLEVDKEVEGLFQNSGRGDSLLRLQRAHPLLHQEAGGAILARDPEGMLVMHTAVLPRTFKDGPHLVRGALLTTPTVAASHRDFWTPVNFLREATELLRERGSLDFVYADPGENGAAMFRASSFDLLGSLLSYVFPLVPGWSSYLRHEFPVAALDVERMSWEKGADLLSSLPDLDSGNAFRVIRTKRLHESWIRANQTEESEWIVLRVPGQPVESSPAARVLLTPTSTRRTLGITDLAWDAAQVSLESLLYAVTSNARGDGFRKLAIRTLRPSRLGQAMARCGFIARSGEQPILTRVLSEGTVLPSPHRWLLTWIDGDVW